MHIKKEINAKIEIQRQEYYTLKKNTSFMCAIGINESKELYTCVTLLLDDRCSA